MARTRKRKRRAPAVTKEDRERFGERLIFSRAGRFYGDFRGYDVEGGGREALAPRGKSWGTTDPAIAVALYDARLEELKEKRRKHAGVDALDEVRPTTLAQLIQRHLVRKEEADLSSQHLSDLEHRLAVALAYFGEHRDPRTIDPDHVRAWMKDLAGDGTRKPGTVRHYLNALSGLYGRAQEGRHVAPGYNPVSALQEKPPTVRATEAHFFEVADAALLLEAARILEQRDRLNATPGLHAIIATFLLTGGRYSEVLGLDVDDVSFDRGIVHFRPNVHRRLKTSTSRRSVPLWPQLRDVLQGWIFGGDAPRTSGLLFSSAHGEKVRDLRKSLDQMAELAGMEPGAVRSRAFRHTYCAARLQTVERILRPGMDPAAPDSWDYVEVPRDRVSREMGHGGTQLVARIYGHAPRLPYRADAVEYRVEQHREQLGERLTAMVATR